MLHEQVRHGLVTTIIPVQNRPRLLAEAVASVLAQTYRPIEIVVVDDGSTDDTPQVAETLRERHPDEVAVLRQPNCGPGPAREAGRRAARGEFVQYLDSDDLLLPDKFERQVAALQADIEAGIAYGKTRYYQHGAEPLDVAWKRTGECIETLFPSMLHSRWWGTSTPLYRRALLDRAGAWSDLWLEEDWEYDCRIATQGVRLAFCDTFVSDEREHRKERLSRSDAATQRRTLASRAEAHRRILGHAQAAGIPADSPEMRHFVRELFFLCRQCGAAGLAVESRLLHRLAVAATAPATATPDLRVYGALARMLGWRATARLAGLSERLRQRIA